MQKRFLEDAGVDECSALMQFNLAPLATRRDMAMMGILHRAAIGKGPMHFREIFQWDKLKGQVVVKTGNAYMDSRETLKSPLIRRSILGLVTVYNQIPMSVRLEQKVRLFQTALQDLLKRRCQSGCADWKDTFSPRVPLRSTTAAMVDEQDFTRPV